MQFLAVCPPNSKNSFFVFVGALALVHFLFHVALPWKMTHQAPRSNSSDVLDMAWVCAFPWFSVTDKHNYKEMCAVVTTVQSCVVPSRSPLTHNIREYYHEPVPS